VDEALPLPGLWSGTHPAALQPLAGFLGFVLGKLKGRRWGSRLPRQRQQYWWKGFGKQAARERIQVRSVAVLRQLVSQWVILSTHSLKYFEVRRLEQPPYRILAVTPALEVG
jgi:hypothetical protein